MKKMILSFTVLVTSFVKGEISEEELKNIDFIIFGCTRDHIFKYDITESVPMEVSWCNEEHEGSYTEQVPLHMIEVDVLMKYQQLRSILSELDQAGKIKYKYKGEEGYSDIIEKYKNEYSIFYRGTWSQ